MNAKHTPGPWEYNVNTQGRFRVFAGTSEIVRALSTHGRRRLGKAEREANARLIAAAPGLLEALREAEDVLNALDMSGYSQADVLATVRVAIAKAEGRS